MELKQNITACKHKSKHNMPVFFFLYAVILRPPCQTKTHQKTKTKVKKTERENINKTLFVNLH